MSSDLLEWGKYYIANGWACLMLATDGVGGKVPPHNCSACDFRAGAPIHDMASCTCLTCHAIHAATFDPERLALAEKALGQGYLAIRTGQISNLLVVDAEAVSKKEGEPSGLEVLDDWESWSGGFSLPKTRSVRTVSGGLHLYYSIPSGVNIKSGRVLPNVDVKAEGGYVAAPCGKDNRQWIDLEVEVAGAPEELIAWLLARKRRGFGNGSGGETGHSDGYDYEVFARDGCPDGHRDEFFNDLLFRLRKKGLTRVQFEQAAQAHWLRCAQPPEARYEMPWEDVSYKVDYVWNTVVSDDFTAPWSYDGGGAAGTHNGRGSESTASRPRRGETIGGGSVGDQPPDEPTSAGSAESNPSPGNEHLTESGNAARFVKLFHGKWLFVPGLGWHQWTGVAWELDEINLVFHDTLDVVDDIRFQADLPGQDVDRLATHALRSESMGYRNAALKGASAHPLMAASYERMNTNPYLLVVQNGTLDLKDQRIRDSRPADYNTQIADVAYDQDAICPHWEAHISLVTSHKDLSPDRELASFIQRWCGYSLTGLVQEQKFFFGFGEGSNGKNTIIETILGILGSYGMRGSSKLLLGSGQEHETIIADLAGARMVFIDETPKGRVNESRIKELTGAGRMRARKIARDSFEFDAKFKMWIAGNNKPRVADTSEGFWRRLDLVPFDVQIPKERRVKDYANTLQEEWPGVLRWALDGLRAYLEIGLEPPSRVAVAREAYRDAENSFSSFVEETFVVDSPERVWHPNQVLHTLYRRWCEGEGIERVMSMQQLSGDLERNHFTRDPVTRRIRWGSGIVESSKIMRGWIGPPVMVELPNECLWRQ